MTMSRNNMLLSKANVAIRRNRPSEDAEWEYDIREQVVRFAEEPLRPVNMTFICFRSTGCRFDRRGECTMCNYNIHSFTEREVSEHMLDFIEEAIAKKQHYEYLFMNPLGSMFDPYEVPPDVRRGVFELATATDCTSFGCETRPEFLTQEVVAEFAAAFEGKKKIVCIGLETSDPWILRNCIAKSMTPDDFRASAELLHQNGVQPVANILLGAPFLTDREVIDSTVRSIRWALENGGYMCVLFPSNVKRWTLEHWLWERDLYHSPSLWSLIEVLYILGPELSQTVGLAWIAPEPSPLFTEIPQTCPKCYGDVVEVLHEFNARADFGLIESLRRSACDCRARWKRKVLAPVSLPLYERVATLYQRIAIDLIGPNWWQEKKDDILHRLTADYDPTRLGKSEVTSLGLE